MPNWCENELTVSGDEATVQKFKKRVKAKDTALSLAKLFPEPDYSKVKVKPTFPSITKEVRKGQEWWDWRIQNWGTKWDVEAELVDDWGNGLAYQFDSAWSPPTKWLETISAKWPDLTFKLKYDEPGMGFAGVAVATAGKIQDAAVEY